MPRLFRHIASAVCALGLFLTNSATAQSVSQCNTASNGYSIAQAAGHLLTARDAIESCASATGAAAGACKRAYNLLSDADIAIVEVWKDSADERKECWVCQPSYLYTEAAALARLAKTYNTIIDTNGAYYYSDAHLTLEGLNTGWNNVPLCADLSSSSGSVSGSTAGQSGIPLSGAELENDKCTMGFYSPSGDVSMFDVNMQSDQCYLIFRENSNGITDFLISIYSLRTGTC